MSGRREIANGYFDGSAATVAGGLGFAATAITRHSAGRYSVYLDAAYSSEAVSVVVSAESVIPAPPAVITTSEMIRCAWEFIGASNEIRVICFDGLGVLTDAHFILKADV